MMKAEIDVFYDARLRHSEELFACDSVLQAYASEKCSDVELFGKFAVFSLFVYPNTRSEYIIKEFENCVL